MAAFAHARYDDPSARLFQQVECAGKALVDRLNELLQRCAFGGQNPARRSEPACTVGIEVVDGFDVRLSGHSCFLA